jgi:hypothetical protein
VCRAKRPFEQNLIQGADPGSDKSNSAPSVLTPYISLAFFFDAKEEAHRSRCEVVKIL